MLEIVYKWLTVFVFRPVSNLLIKNLMIKKVVNHLFCIGTSNIQTPEYLSKVKLAFPRYDGPFYVMRLTSNPNYP